MIDRFEGRLPRGEPPFCTRCAAFTSRRTVFASRDGSVTVRLSPAGAGGAVAYAADMRSVLPDEARAWLTRGPALGVAARCLPAIVAPGLLVGLVGGGVCGDYRALGAPSDVLRAAGPHSTLRTDRTASLARGGIAALLTAVVCLPVVRPVSAGVPRRPRVTSTPRGARSVHARGEARAGEAQGLRPERLSGEPELVAVVAVLAVVALDAERVRADRGDERVRPLQAQVEADRADEGELGVEDPHHRGALARAGHDAAGVQVVEAGVPVVVLVLRDRVLTTLGEAAALADLEALA
ncbi:hypothetical protein [Streptomyces olivochromogenes]|uniref:hypothetical protein n=1 Tax=Streptomyces olivochromogenes TaxID=1963 RepID=UPI00368E3174